MSLVEETKACTSLDDAVALLESGQVDDVRIGLVDVNTIVREKIVRPAKAVKLLKQGYSFCDVLYKWDLGENLRGQGDFADEAARIDPASLRCTPFMEKSVTFLADFAGPTADLSPRNLALRQIERARNMGLAVRSAFEFEFFLFDETAATLREKGYRNLTSFLPGNWTYSAQSMVEGSGFLNGLMAVMEKGNIPVEALHTELGPGCVEMPLGAEMGIKAADDAVFFKAFTKSFASQNGKTATFMSKWSNDWPGQSGHLHLSLVDADSGEPVFADKGGEQDTGENPRPNKILRSFVAGVVAYLPELLAMIAHTANAYRRLVPGAWAPTHACWGIQNRSTSVRVILDPAEASRVECRVPAADCNPYLAFAACLAAGLDGIERNMEPPPQSIGDAYDEAVSPDRRFPRSLWEAAERLQASETARRLFGDGFVDWFADSRIHEDRIFRAHVSDLDVQRYFEKI